MDKVEITRLRKPRFEEMDNIRKYVKSEAAKLKKQQQKTVPFAIFATIAFVCAAIKVLSYYVTSDVRNLKLTILVASLTVFLGIIAILILKYLITCFSGTEWQNMMKCFEKNNCSVLDVTYSYILVDTNVQDMAKAMDLTGNEYMHIVNGRRISRAVRVAEECGGRGLLVCLYDDSKEFVDEFIIPIE